MTISKASVRLVLALLVIELLSACGREVPPSPTTSPDSTATRTPLATVRIVSYNILFGGGRDRSLDWHIDEKYRGIDRTPMLVEYLKQLDADVIGLEEATGWDEGQPPYIQTVAEQLGMQYVIVPDHGWGLDSALLTRYPVLDTEDLSNEVNSILRARLQGPDGEPVNVFVAHLNSDSAGDRSCGAQLLLRKMEPYHDQRTFLIGDMNWQGRNTDEWPPKGLQEGGWQLLKAGQTFSLDQIWAPAAMEWTGDAWDALRNGDLRKMSDHLPVGLEVRIYSSSGALRSEPTVTPIPEYTKLPDAVSSDLPRVELAFEQHKDAVCIEQHWADSWNAASFADGTLHIFGKGDWQSGAGWSKPISENQAMMIDFKSSPDAEFNIFLEHALWDQPEYRRFGMYLDQGGIFQSDMWFGSQGMSGDRWNGIGPAKPNVWYRLLLVAREQGSFAAYLWPSDDPSKVAQYSREMGADWAGLDWRLSLGVNRGGLDVHQVMQLNMQPAE